MVFLLWGVVGAFPHAPHADSLQCLDCHRQAQTSEMASDVLLPDPQRCLGCHDSVMNYTLPESTSLWIGVFSHRIHQDEDCQDCHGKTSSVSLPKMKVCLACHDRDEVRSDCWMCHVRDDPKLVSYHPKKWLQRHPFRAGPQCFQCHWKNQDATEENPTPGCLPCHNRPH